MDLCLVLHILYGSISSASLNIYLGTMLAGRFYVNISISTSVSLYQLYDIIMCRYPGTHLSTPLHSQSKPGYDRFTWGETHDWYISSYCSLLSIASPPYNCSLVSPTEHTKCCHHGPSGVLLPTNAPSGVLFPNTVVASATVANRYKLDGKSGFNN